MTVETSPVYIRIYIKKRKENEKARGIVTAACKSLECFSAQVVSTWQRQLCRETPVPSQLGTRHGRKMTVPCVRKCPSLMAATRLHNSVA